MKAPVILVVEDEVALAEAIGLYLRRNAYDTVLAHSGEDALRLAGLTSPDLAVVDVMLPGIDGLEVTRRLRTSSPATRVVMMTALDPRPWAASMAALRVSDCLLKPFDLARLRAAVTGALAAAR
jgi:DNA-binding response OmpR family regulator